MERKKSSIRSVGDLVIALGAFAVACSVIALITMPVVSSVLPAVVSASDFDCDSCEIPAISVVGDLGLSYNTKLELPTGSAIWMCQYLVYSNETEDLIGIDLGNHEDWAKYGELITEITGLDNQEQWETLYQDMIYKKPYVEGYLEDQGFCVISCLDCEYFWHLVEQANECECPVRIAMYDCCCVVCPIIPVFVY